MVENTEKTLTAVAVEIDDETVEFFNNIVKALTAVCAAHTDTGKVLPAFMTSHQMIAAVLGSKELKEKQKEIIESKEFPELCNEFVKSVKEGVKEKKEKKK